MSGTDGTQREESSTVGQRIPDEVQRGANCHRRVADPVQTVLQVAVRYDDQAERRKLGQRLVAVEHVATGTKHAGRVHQRDGRDRGQGQRVQTGPGGPILPGR